MALPASGPLSISQIATEFGDSAPNSMSEFYRGGGLVPDAPDNASIPTSGAIAIGDFYGATNRVAVPLTISANTQNYNVYTQATASPLYTAGIADVTLTIQPGVVVGSSSTGTYALNIPSAFNAGDTVTVVNNGTVIGRGGNGGNGSPSPGGGGGTGGNAGSAVYVQFTTVFTNNGTIAGGGGGGGGGAAGRIVNPPTNPKQPAGPVSYQGGGGGGGGAGYTAGSGGSGGSAQPAPGGTGSPGGGGSSGSTTSGGGGGSGPGPAGAGGSGGGQGANGSSGGPGPYGSGGGGGVRGYYMVGNPFVTYPATGTRLGQVS